MTPTLLLLLALWGAPPRPPAADVNVAYAEIAALIDDERLDDAERQLRAAVLPEAARRRLSGLIALRRGRHDDAVRDFSRALAVGHDDPTLRLYLASAQLGRGDAPAALAALDGTDALGDTVVAQPLLLARARLGTGDVDGAYAALEAASRRFADDAAPRIELMALCAAHDLPVAARAWAHSVIALRGDALDRDTAAAIFAATWRDRGALPLLEQLAARFGDDAELRAQLAFAWAAHGKPYAAATLFEQASGRAGTYAFEAADQYRLAGMTRRALANNARVVDRARRVDQRIDILFGAGEMARVVALGPEAARVGVVRPATRMRLAHAHWTLGQYTRAAEIARTLLDGDEAERARTLLRAMGRDATGTDG